MTTTTATRVRLHGQLATEMGRDEWEFHIHQPREVVAALDANTDGRFRSFLMRERAVEYHFIVDGRAILPVPDERNPDRQGIPPEFYMVGEFETVDIIPVPAGAGGLWQTIAGAVLTVVGIALLFTPLAPLASYAILGGLALAAGGVAQMLAPDPQLGLTTAAPNVRGPLITNTERSGGTKLTSYLFNGVANPVGEGGPVPLCYGEMLIGSQVVSIGLYGASLQGATIGSDKPPGEGNYFFELPMWDALAAQGKAALIRNALAVNQLTAALVNQYWTDPFWLSPTYPADWPVVNLRGKAIAVAIRRKYLVALSNLFNNNLASVTLAQARDLYRLLKLNTLSQFDFEHSGWNLAVQQVGQYYLTHELTK